MGKINGIPSKTNYLGKYFFLRLDTFNGRDDFEYEG